MINVPYEDMPREIEALLGEIEQLEQENQQLRYYKFYKYENNPNGSDYCFCQRPCESNMSLKCFLENGEILCFMSETLVINHPKIKEVDLNEFMHQFVKPLIKENQQLKEALENLEIINAERSNLIVEDMKELVKYKSVVDEIREYIEGVITIWKTNPSAIATLDLEYLLQQIDKVKE